MCNKAECKWNINGHQCINTDVIEKLKEENTICNKGVVIKEHKILCNYRVI
ncbi:hypothetical protein [Clostridium baratii]|uniref:hypothetical protein n=1 Tax=Clostridium baratii TaxID=1561 RepID=UPI0030D05667